MPLVPPATMKRCARLNRALSLEKRSLLFKSVLRPPDPCSCEQQADTAASAAPHEAFAEDAGALPTPGRSTSPPSRAREQHGHLTAAGGCRWEAEYRVVPDEQDQIEATLKQLVRLLLLSHPEPGVLWELPLSRAASIFLLLRRPFSHCQ